MDEKMEANIRDGFWKGEITTIHSIGEYQLIEFTVPQIAMAGAYNGPRFAVFVDGKDTGQWCQTLDEALLVALAEKYDEPNAARLMARMLRMERPNA